MAHPMKKDSMESHGDKLRRMTENYGSASGPNNNIAAPTNRFKQEGPEEHVGFGADSTKPRARADRRSRQQLVSNPVATYKKGGRVRRADGGPTGSLPTTADSPVEEANLNQSATNRARGGRTKHKGSTHVNVIVGGPGGMMRPPPVIPPGGPMVPPAGAPPPPMMPPGAGMPPPGMAGARPMPMAAGAPGGIPPGMIPPRKHGGKVNHPDEAEDKKLIQKTLREEGLTRSDKPVKMGLRERAAGGAVEGVMGPKGRLPNQKHHFDAGALSGEGRLQKIGERPKHPPKPQAV